MWKKIFLSLQMVAFFILPLSAQTQSVKIRIITPEKTYEGIDLLLLGGMGYLRINDVAEVFAGSVDFDPVSKKVMLQLPTGKAEFFVDSSEVVISGIKRRMNKETKVIEGGIWIPLEVMITQALAEVLGYKLTWNYEAKTLSAPENVVGYAKRKTEQAVSQGEGASIQSKVAKKRIKTIVIDPGHGGKDPGALGHNGVKEKDIVLEISRKLAKELHKRLKARVVLTRYHDVFLSLAERAEIANREKADLFISVHCNASLKSSSEGFEVYFLSDEASDEEAQAVANAENAVVALEGKTTKGNELSSILWSLAMNEYMNESSELCSMIVSELDCQLPRVNKRGVKQAGFRVLRGAKMPSVLIEAGFITNPHEAGKLTNDNHQNALVAGVCRGVEKYMEGKER